MTESATGRRSARSRTPSARCRAASTTSSARSTEKGVAAPPVAFGFSFSILFREGLEAVLLIAILLGSLEAARAANYRRPLAWGAAAAHRRDRGDVRAVDDRDRARAGEPGGAGGGARRCSRWRVLFVVTFWLVSRLEQRRWMEFMRSRVSAAVATGGAIAFAGLGFTAIYREGFETVLFYQALTLYAEGLMLWVALGAAVAAAALGARRLRDLQARARSSRSSRC